MVLLSGAAGGPSFGSLSMLLLLLLRISSPYAAACYIYMVLLSGASGGPSFGSLSMLLLLLLRKSSPYAAAF
jgi:hypothetical protein